MKIEQSLRNVNGTKYLLLKQDYCKYMGIDSNVEVEYCEDHIKVYPLKKEVKENV